MHQRCDYLHQVGHSDADGATKHLQPRKSLRREKQLRRTNASVLRKEEQTLDQAKEQGTLHLLKRRKGPQNAYETLRVGFTRAGQLRAKAHHHLPKPILRCQCLSLLNCQQRT